jgi:hypothetical protein
MGLCNVVNGVQDVVNGVIQRGKRGSGLGKWGYKGDWTEFCVNSKNA